MRFCCSTGAMANGRRAPGAIRKRDLVLECVEQTKPLETVPDFWLCAAPIKKGRIDLVIEKATELGVARIQPVLMARCVVDKLNPERLDRTDDRSGGAMRAYDALPNLAETVKLDALLKELA
jgi:16S rRNA (uracil1498-N3)-methyltransferase